MRSQKEMMEFFGPQITGKGRRYKKYVVVDARQATPGEVIVTVTSSGRETHKTAEVDDMVIRNPTKAGEQYILAKTKFDARYEPLYQGTGPWLKYQARGEIMAMRYDGPETKFEASWGEAMMLKSGDMLAMPYPDQNEIYRIAIVEFGETYAPA